MFYPTLSAALDAALANLTARDGLLEGCGEQREILAEPFQFGGIPYGTNKSANYPLLSLKGKKTRKYYHVVLTRMGTGSYELVEYVL